MLLIEKMVKVLYFEKNKKRKDISLDPNLLLVIYRKEIIKYVEKDLWTKIFINILSRTEKSC